MDSYHDHFTRRPRALYSTTQHTVDFIISTEVTVIVVDDFTSLNTRRLADAVDDATLCPVTELILIGLRP